MPWVFLAIEPSHGITMALRQAVAVQYAQELSPVGMHAQVQGVVSGVDGALSSCAGCILGGYLFHHFGPEMMW